MIVVFNPDLFEVESSQKDTGKGSFFFEDVYTLEPKKREGEPERKRIPFTTLKLKYDTELSALENVAAFINSYKKTGKNGKLNISTKVIECEEGKGHHGFIAAIPFKGLISSLGFDASIEPLKFVVKRVDKFTYNDATYNNILYVIGRSSNDFENLIGGINFTTNYFFNNDGKRKADGSYDKCAITNYNLSIINNVFEYKVEEPRYEVDPEKLAELKNSTISFVDLNNLTEQYAKEYKPFQREGGRPPRNNNKRNENNVEDFINTLRAEEAAGKTRKGNRRRKDKYNH